MLFAQILKFWITNIQISFSKSHKNLIAKVVITIKFNNIVKIAIKTFVNNVPKKYIQKENL